MYVRLKISDDLMDKYSKKFGLTGAYDMMRRAIEQYQDVDKDDRVVLLGGDNRRAVEAIFQTTVDDSAKLVKLVQNMNSVKLGNVEMGFTADEYARLSMQATFHGRTLETFVREMVTEIKDRMLEKV